MNPWEILGWVTAISLSTLVATIALAVVIDTVRNLKPKREGSEQVFDSADHTDRSL